MFVVCFLLFVFFYLAKEYRCELYGKSTSRVGYTGKHDKMKAWHLDIDMDYKGMLEQIIRNCGILYKARKCSCVLLIVNDLYYLSIGATRIKQQYYIHNIK